ncbi:FAD-dependent oxidoreductase [soil metagenome]
MIARDGANISLWQDSTEAYSGKGNNTATNYDIIIVGGGITGISLGLQSQKAGKRCIILEANTICFGTTSGTTAHLNTLFDTTYDIIIKKFGEESAALVATAAKEALALIKSNIEMHHIDCGFEEATAYTFSQDEKQGKELNEILEGCGKAKVEAAYTDTIPVDIAFNKAIRVPGQAKFSPVEYVNAIAAAFEKAGGVIAENMRVIKHTERKDQVQQISVVDVETDAGIIFTGNALVYATHIPPGINILHFRCAPYRSYAIAVKLADDNYPEGLIYDMYDPYHYYRTQEVNGQKYFIAGGEDHKTAHEENTEKCFQALESYVRAHFNVASITHKWSSQYYEPVDGLAYIGNLPGAAENIFVATGFGGNGMTYSHIAAITLTELLTKKESGYEKLFDPNRIKPLAGFSNFVKENADVVKNFVGKWFSNTALESLSGIAKGEGKVVEFENHKIALYKDEKGNLHAVNPTCTHVKCSVAWNSTEQSWDCPCHGARYSPDGKVLNGPADRDLEKIELTTLLNK